MTIEAKLRTDRSNKDGTHSLRIYVNHNLLWKYYPTGIKLLPEQWDSKRQQVKGLARPIAKSYNAKIHALKLQYAEKLEKGIPANQLNSSIIGDQKHNYLLDFLSLFIKEAKAGLHKVEQSTVRNYISAYNRLKEYCRSKAIPDLAFHQIDMDWYRNYYLWMQNNQYGQHGFDNHIKIVKRIMRESYHRGLHSNQVWQIRDFKPMKKGFADKIYLSQEEIELLENLDLSSMPHLDREKDRFLISYYFLMRWEDSTLINDENVVDNYYSYIAKKTGVKCLIPISTKARQLLEKRNFNFNTDSNQKCNEKIKVIGSIAGINKVLLQSGRTAPKFNFITTHTARRSAATNLYMQGMDLETIARLGGWKKLETLKIYLRASGMDVVRNASKFDFFQ